MNIFSLLFSDCCDAEPTQNSITDEGGEILGICSCCREWATFYDDEMRGEDWDDEIEYMREHNEL